MQLKYPKFVICRMTFGYSIFIVRLLEAIASMPIYTHERVYIHTHMQHTHTHSLTYASQVTRKA